MRKLRPTSALVLACASVGASAQSTDEGSSDDAFGRLVGTESIGLYGETQVRGFNLENAGNYRIEGNYYARVSSPFYLIRQATTVRIGVNALRYDFPAPSGVVEYDLKSIAPGKALSIEAGKRTSGGPVFDITGSAESSDGRLGILAAASLQPHQRYANGADGDFWGVGTVARWNPGPSVKLTAFGAYSDWWSDPDTGYAPQGEFLPPKIKRGVLRTQPWTIWKNRRENAGLFGSAELGEGWKVSGGFVYSASQTPRNDFNLAEIDSPAGDYHASAFVVPGLSGESKSGSVLVERSWGSEKLRQRIVGTVRTRQTINRSGLPLLFNIGDSNLAEPFPKVAEPEFTIDDGRVVDRTRQNTVGVGYRIGIGGRIELRADVQKTDYKKTRTALDGTRTSGDSNPWLYSASALFGVTPRLTVFGSYSRGLEESGVAPNSATNRGEVLPAVLATQRELGARYSFTPNLSLIGGLFDTRKPTPGLGPDGRFDLIGDVQHRGFEASLAGSLTPRLDIVAGLMLLDATLSGPLVDQQIIGRHAVARPDHIALLNLTWRPKWVDGLSLDASVNRLGRAYISSSNVTKSKLQTTLDVGARYSFQLGKQAMSLRARVLNVFNAFYWQPDTSGTLYPNLQRNYGLTLQAEF